jgi:hypothetical protein
MRFPPTNTAPPSTSPVPFARTPLSGRDSALRDAPSFFRRQYDPSVSLLREAPLAAPNRYWLLNDNAVATLALDALNEGVLAGQLRATLWSKGMLAADGSPIGSPLAVLWGKTVEWPPKSFVYTRVSGAPLGAVDPGSLCYGSSCAFEVVYEHWDGGGTFADWAEYANLAAIGALNEWNAGRPDEARRIFADLMRTFDGTGFPDKGYLASPQHEYETFKLALALDVGLKIGGLDGPTARSLADALLAKQHAADGTNQAGGFHTHYTATELRGDVNTETTSLAILALREYGS